jgi:DNA-binding GntR family transcriptional regulator
VIQRGKIPAVPDSYRVEQTISASTLSPEIAEALDAIPGCPALIVTRRVFEHGGRLIHLEIHTHRADQFEVTTVIQPGKTPSGRHRKR